MTQQTDIRLHFVGGPLDGSSRSQRIPADWVVIRYEHLPRANASAKHVYGGNRDPDDDAVQLQYLGVEHSEPAA